MLLLEEYDFPIVGKLNVFWLDSLRASLNDHSVFQEVTKRCKIKKTSKLLLWRLTSIIMLGLTNLAVTS